MNTGDALGCLESKWRDYLENKGHRIHKSGSYLSVVRSRNSKKDRYRWLLLIGQGLKRTLSKSEISNIHQHLREAKLRKEVTFLVVGFVKEPSSIVVLPVDAALKGGLVRSDKGGIAWDD